jgi:N-acetyl-gamma-glutamylphosphate reductase
MKIISGLDYDPAFCPVVADFYSGMETIIPLFKSQINGTLQDIQKVYEDLYRGPLVKYEAFAKDGMISAAAMKLRDDLLVHAEGNEDRILLVSSFDNLGKGASGAASAGLKPSRPARYPMGWAYSSGETCRARRPSLKRMNWSFGSLSLLIL